ncbi:MAG: hypothetical protein QM765_31090 [Myxococcales bacterium]
MDPSPEAAAPAAETRFCAAHPAAEACALCDRCGAFVCPACRRSVDGQVLCAACEDRRSNRPPSREAKASLVLALLGPLGLAPGIAGGILAWHELGRIRRGESPATGAGYCQLAQALGVLYALVLLLGIISLVNRFVPAE